MPRQDRHTHRSSVEKPSGSSVPGGGRSPRPLIEKGSSGYGPHGENRADPPEESRDLRLPTRPRRAARPRCQMRTQAGLRGCLRGRRRITRRDRGAVPAPDRVRREFTAPARDRPWLADVTVLKTDEGFLHLALLLDVHIRRVRTGLWLAISGRSWGWTL